MFISAETSIGSLEGNSLREVIDQAYQLCYDNIYDKGDIWFESIEIELNCGKVKSLCNRVINLIQYKLENKLDGLQDDINHHQ